jgi:fatty acid desaturase
VSADTDTWAYSGRRYTMYRFAPDVERDLKALNTVDNWHAPLAWLEDLVWVCGCVLLCIYGSYWFYPLAALVIGARQRGLNSLLHECAHGVAVSNRKLQMVIGTVLTAYPIFQQHYPYKTSHVYTHHPRLGSPDLDPDLRFFIEQGVYERSAAPKYVRRVVLMPLLGWQTWAYFRYVIRNRSKSTKPEKSSAPANPMQRRKRLLDRLAVWAVWATVVGTAWYGGWLLEL